MSEWECGVCGYIHKEDHPPEKCPVCEAPEKMFTEKQLESNEDEVAPEVEEQVEPATSQEPLPQKQWRCTVSGYLHTGPTPPDKCPVCDATADQFEEVVETEKLSAAVATPETYYRSTNRWWRCSVCGYLHEADEPPEKCPLCGADRSLFEEVDADGKSLTGEDDGAEAAATEPVITGAASSQDGSTFFDKIAKLSFSLHLHSIHTHFPNGILPVIVAFLGLSIFFNIASLATAAFYNSIAVLVVLPVVIFTGYIEWQKRYKGIKTMVFITKIICALTVLASVNVLVFWRVIDPAVATEGSVSQMLYFAVAAVALGAAGIAGHLGGKLAFSSRS